MEQEICDNFDLKLFWLSWQIIMLDAENGVALDFNLLLMSR